MMRLQTPVATLCCNLILSFGIAHAQQNSFFLKSSEAQFTFEYSSSNPVSTNWIGLWPASGGGPIDEKSHSPSLVWRYAPESRGSVILPSSNLQPGNYTAYFLARDGYGWIADPVNVSLSVKPPSRRYLEFIATTVKLPNARQGDPYYHNISGLVTGSGSGQKFSKSSSGDDWLSVSSDGILSGTPDQSAYEAVVTVLLADENGSPIATAQFTILVRPSGYSLVPEFQVLTFNMWHGGTLINNYHEKQVRFLAASGADIVGLQEDQSGNHAPRLARALGWYYWISGGTTSILSKYPIVENYGAIATEGRAGGVRIALDGERQQINFYVAHLGYTPYGPYDFCFDNMTKEQVLEREAVSGRTPQILTILAGIETHLERADEIPVMLVGDFNAPSHLDWTEALKEKNCGVWDVNWPTSVLPEQMGLIDSFRVANPDPAVIQATTWSPITPWNSDRNLPEPQDRIDYIYHKGNGLNVRGSTRVIVGEPKPIPHYKDNEWPSDHAAVLTSYEFRS